MKNSLLKGAFWLLLLALCWPHAATAQERGQGALKSLLERPTEDKGDDITIDEPDSCIEQPLGDGCRVVRIDAVIIEGLGRTQRYVVMRELLFEEGDYASMSQIKESITRLLNLGLFREVDWQLISKKAELVDGQPPEQNPKRPARVLKIRVDERWTLLPFFTLVQGGGLTQFATGGSDINLFGRYLTAGVQYDRLGLNETFLQPGGAANSFVVWFQDPRFLNSRTSAGIDLWRITRLRSIYEPDGTLEGGFSLERRIAILRFQREFKRWLYGGLNFEWIDDGFSYDFIPEATREIQQDNFGGLPSGGRAITARGNMRFGRVNRDDFYYDGWSLTQWFGHTDKLWGSDFRFSQLESILVAYKKIPFRGNLAARVRLGFTNTEQIQYLYYMGGLNRVRGYRDSQFRGNSYWAVNAEYRVAPIASRWFALQMVGFVDSGATADSLNPFIELDAASVGGGVRIISPKIYGFVARFDYAYPIINGAGGALSFGAQQFF